MEQLGGIRQAFTVRRILPRRYEKFRSRYKEKGRGNVEGKDKEVASGDARVCVRAVARCEHV